VKIVIHKTVIVPIDVDLKLGHVLLRDGYSLRVFEDSLLRKILRTEET
jgi:hypothetical protein